jgi:PhzF family phenazine biosynthesis protein
MDNLKFWQVDAFSSKPFQGNPAAVVILHETLTDKLMQNIAQEMNLSDTGFILIRDNQQPLLRWFTPSLEIELCGHATLASAHIYFSEVDTSIDEITFDTKSSGPITIAKENGCLTMQFPIIKGKEIPLADIPDFVISSLSSFKPICAIQDSKLMLVYEDSNIITNMTPDFSALKKYDHTIIVTSLSKDTNYDFISRFFCVPHGHDEDPVTGSAHCTLAPYWSEKLNKKQLSAFQASKRGGTLKLQLEKDILFITGEAITIFEGTILLDNIISSRQEEI